MRLTRLLGRHQTNPASLLVPLPVLPFMLCCALPGDYSPEGDSDLCAKYRQRTLHVLQTAPLNLPYGYYLVVPSY